MSKANDDTFYKITNKDIYQKLLEQDKKLEAIEQHAIHTNGKVKYNTGQITMLWTAFGTALMAVVGVLLWMIQHGEFD